MTLQSVTRRQGWKSVAFIAVLLGGFDFGVILNLGLLRFGKTTLRELGWTFDNVGRDLALGLLGFAVCGGLLTFALVGSGDLDFAGLLRLLADYTVTQRIIFATIGVFGAAMVEETLFRAYLQTALAKRFGIVIAIGLQAVVFDLMHMNFRPASLILKFTYGVIFGILRGRDRSLLAPGIAHGLIWAVFGAP